MPELKSMKIRIVSLVGKAANRRQLLIVKNDKGASEVAKAPKVDVRIDDAIDQVRKTRAVVNYARAGFDMKTPDTPKPSRFKNR